MKFYPYEKGDRESFSYDEGGHNKFWGSFYFLGSFSTGA